MADLSGVERTVDKKRQLLDAAERVYCQHGNLGLTVRRLAAEGDTTSQTIYTYFGSRDAVIVAMHDRAVGELEQMLQQLNERLQAAGDPQGRLLGVAMAYRAYSLEHPAHFKMLAEGVAPEDGDPATIRGLQAHLVGLVEQAQMGAGIMSQGDNSLGARQSIALLHGLIQAELDGFLKPEDSTDSAVSGVIGRLMGLDEKVDANHS